MMMRSSFLWGMSLVGYDADTNVEDVQLKHRGKHTSDDHNMNVFRDWIAEGLHRRR